MELQVAAICRTRDRNLLELEQDYRKRFPKQLPLVVRELGGDRYLKHSEAEQQRYHSELVEGLGLAPRELVLLDERGKQLSTLELSQFLEREAERGLTRMVFAVGGPNGWSESLRSNAGCVLSLSRLTLPYQLARLVLIEQLYRCMTIQTNVPYHR